MHIGMSMKLKIDLLKYSFIDPADFKTTISRIKNKNDVKIHSELQMTIPVRFRFIKSLNTWRMNGMKLKKMWMKPIVTKNFCVSPKNESTIFFKIWWSFISWENCILISCINSLTNLVLISLTVLILSLFLAYSLIFLTFACNLGVCRSTTRYFTSYLFCLFFLHFLIHLAN